MSEAKTKEQKIGEIRAYLLRMSMADLCAYAEHIGNNPKSALVTWVLFGIVDRKIIDVVHAGLFDEPKEQS